MKHFIYTFLVETVLTLGDELPEPGKVKCRNTKIHLIKPHCLTMPAVRLTLLMQQIPLSPVYSRWLVPLNEEQ